MGLVGIQIEIKFGPVSRNTLVFFFFWKALGFVINLVLI